jgi:hypothetical protein
MATSRRPQRSSTIPVHGTPFAGPTAVSWSPPTGARGSSTLAHPRSPTMTSPVTPVHITTSSFNVGSSQDSPAPFEPRIIRGSSSRATYDPTSRSPPAARGPARATSARRPSQGSTARRPSLVHPTLPSRPTPSTDSEPNVFPRPVYLEHSVLRDFLQTDQPRPSTSASATSIQLSRSPVPPAPDPRSTFADPIPRHVRLAREDTPATDSDDDSVFSVVQRPVATTLPTPSVSIMSSGNPVLRLPTRWSEQDRHPSLSVSQNGRELTYRGQSLHSQVRGYDSHQLRATITPREGCRCCSNQPPHSTCMWYLLLRDRSIAEGSQRLHQHRLQCWRCATGTPSWLGEAIMGIPRRRWQFVCC